MIYINKWRAKAVVHVFTSVQFSSIAVSCPTLYDLMDCSTPGLPVHHQLPEFMQTHVHCVGDAIQSSQPLSSPSPTALNLSQHQGLFQWVSSSHQVAETLEFQLQHQSFQWIFRTDFLEDGLLGSPCCPKDSQESSLAPQFKSINSSVLSLLLWSNSHIGAWLLAKNSFDYTDFVSKVIFLLFNMLPWFVIVFLPKSKCLLI